MAKARKKTARGTTKKASGPKKPRKTGKTRRAAKPRKVPKVPKTPKAPKKKPVKSPRKQGTRRMSSARQHAADLRARTAALASALSRPPFAAVPPPESKAEMEADIQRISGLGRRD